MHNVTQKVSGTKLLIEIDLPPAALEAAKPSATGKTLLLASTHGTREVQAVSGRVITYSLNVMVRRNNA
jgi:hypothetical protein